MKKLKIMIITSIIIIIILIIAILLLIKINNKKMLAKEEQENLNVINNSGYLLLGKKPEKVTLKNIYFSVEACLEKTLEYARNDKSKELYDVLNKEYTKEKSITQNNIIDKTGIKSIEKFKIQEIYQITGMDYSSYYIKAITKGNKNIYFNINWDNANSAFDMRNLTKTQYEKYIDETIEDVKPKENIIERNENNAIPYKYLTEDDLAEKYFYDYIESAVNFPEEAFKNLDDQYKKARFENLENFKKYVQTNTEIADLYNEHNTDMMDYDNYMEYLTTRKDVGLERYSVEERNEYTQYTCIDTYNNYYIFRVNNLMEYKLILDTYTIDIPEFIVKYDASNEQEKVILNINKFMLSINNKDYKYAYNLLADSFKENNFKEQADFENYIKTNFFKKNEVSYERFGNETNTYYTYTVSIKDLSKEENKIISKTFIVLLEEDRNFKLSFNI